MEIMRDDKHRVVGTYVSERWIVCLDGEKKGTPCGSEAVALQDKEYYEAQGHTIEIIYIPAKINGQKIQQQG